MRTWPSRERLERPGLAGQRVLQAESHAAASQRRDRRRRDGPPAPSGPSRLPVEALTLTRPAVEPERAPAIASRIASRRSPRRGRAPMIVTSIDGAPPAGGRDAGATTAASSSLLATPARRRVGRPGRGGRGRPARRRRAARRPPRGGRRRRRNGRQARRARDRHPTERAAAAGPERVAVEAEADAGRAGRPASRPHSARADRRARSP